MSKLYSHTTWDKGSNILSEFISAAVTVRTATQTVTDVQANSSTLRHLPKPHKQHISGNSSEILPYCHNLMYKCITIIFWMIFRHSPSCSIQYWQSHWSLHLTVLFNNGVKKKNICSKHGYVFFLVSGFINIFSDSDQYFSTAQASGQIQKEKDCSKSKVFYEGAQ